MLKTGAIILSAANIDHGFCPISIVDNEPLITGVIRMLKNCDIDTVCVVTGDRHDILNSVLNSCGAQLLFNENHQKCHMLDNIRLAMNTVCSDCDRVLIIRGDVLAFSRSTVKQMLSYVGNIICPVYRNEPGHPILISHPFYRYIFEYNGDDGLEGLLQQHPEKIHYTEVDDRGILLKNNSYESFQEIVELKAKEKNDNQDFHINVSLCIENVSCFFNDESAIFFEMIDKTKSIRIACKCLHFSYTKGWKMINRVESETGIQFVRKTVGGMGGGHTQLTPQGRQYVLTYLLLRKRLVHDADLLFEELGILMRP